MWSYRPAFGYMAPADSISEGEEEAIVMTEDDNSRTFSLLEYQSVLRNRKPKDGEAITCSDLLRLTQDQAISELTISLDVSGMETPKNPLSPSTQALPETPVLTSRRASLSSMHLSEEKFMEKLSALSDVKDPETSVCSPMDFDSPGGLHRRVSPSSPDTRSRGRKAKSLSEFTSTVHSSRSKHIDLSLECLDVLKESAPLDDFDDVVSPSSRRMSAF